MKRGKPNKAYAVIQHRLCFIIVLEKRDFVEKKEVFAFLILVMEYPEDLPGNERPRD